MEGAPRPRVPLDHRPRSQDGSRTGRPLVVPIVEQLREILRDARARSRGPYVVTYRGGPGARRIRDGLHGAAERAGLSTVAGRDGVTFHTVRHTIATMLAERTDIQEGMRKELHGPRQPADDPGLHPHPAGDPGPAARGALARTAARGARHGSAARAPGGRSSRTSAAARAMRSGAASAHQSGVWENLWDPSDDASNSGHFRMIRGSWRPGGDREIGPVYKGFLRWWRHFEGLAPARAWGFESPLPHHSTRPLDCRGLARGRPRVQPGSSSGVPSERSESRGTKPLLAHGRPRLARVEGTQTRSTLPLCSPSSLFVPS